MYVNSLNTSACVSGGAFHSRLRTCADEVSSKERLTLAGNPVHFAACSQPDSCEVG